MKNIMTTNKNTLERRRWSCGVEGLILIDSFVVLTGGRNLGANIAGAGGCFSAEARCEGGKGHYRIRYTQCTGEKYPLRPCFHYTTGKLYRPKAPYQHNLSRNLLNLFQGLLETQATDFI